MHYQTRLLPIGPGGLFVSATCHGEHKVGGDDPRETTYASLAVRNVDTAGSCIDLAPVAFPVLRASASRMAQQEDAAKMQDQLADSGNYGPAQTAEYRANAKRMRHAARLASVDRVRVPRRVLASRTGRIALGFEPENATSTGESLSGILRLIDAAAGAHLGDWSSSRFPIDGPGRGIERYSNVQLGRPVALAADGTSVVLRNDMAKPGSVVECRLDDSLWKLGDASFGQGRVMPIREGWVAVDDESAKRWGRGLKCMAQMVLPRGVLGWAACATPDGGKLLLPTTTGGEFCLVDWEGAKRRRFAPHRGARRNAMAVVAISDCGEWIASRCDRDIVVTRVADGVSWPVAALEDRVHDDPSYDGYVVHSYVPAGFGFVGSRLLVCDEAGVREIQLDEAIGKQFVSESGRPGARKPVRANPSMDFGQMMRAARLDAQAEELRALHSPAVTIHSKALGPAGWLAPGKARAPSLGASRLGGWPDLPEGVEWPTWRGRPMSFLAQFDLADLACVQPDARLPKTGLLSFFLGCSGESYEKLGDPRTRYMADVLVGTEPDQGDGWRVVYTAAPERLKRIMWTTSPFPELFDACAVRFTKGGLSLPDERSAIYDQLPLDASQRDDYNELVAQLTPSAERASEQLMGYPMLIQGTPPEIMCELAATGRSPWSFPDLAPDDAAALARAASEWTLLLQLTSQGPFEWGDGGHFYFYGDRSAMERADFSKIWVNFEA
jgi:hypothetical protein